MLIFSVINNNVFSFLTVLHSNVSDRSETNVRFILCKSYDFEKRNIYLVFFFIK